MVDVDKLSDAELRSKLIEFGFPVMPITGTTRKTMAKKLKLLLENKNKIAATGSKESRRSLGRFSSDDESDTDARKSTRFNKRATIAPATMQPPKRPVIIKDPIESPVKSREIKTTTTTTTRTSKILQAAADEFDTGSESDEVADADYRRADSSASPSNHEVFYKKTPTPTRLPTSFISASNAADAALDRISQIRSRHSYLNSSYGKPLCTSSPGVGVDDVLKDGENTPFLSNFTKRLSQLAESPKSSTLDYKNDVIKEHDMNGGNSQPARNYLNSYRTTRGRVTSYDYKANNQQSIFKNNFVPIMVLVVAFLFFLIIGVVYLGIRSDSALEVTATLPLCDRTDLSARRSVNCVLEGDGKAATNLLQVLKPELNKRAVWNRCQDGNIKPYMTEDEIIQFITANYAIQDEIRVGTDLANLELLAFQNPTWGVSILQLDKDGATFTEQLIAKNMEMVIQGRHLKKITALISVNPYIPWRCYLYNTLTMLFNISTSILGGILLSYLLNRSYKYYAQCQQKQREEEVGLVENIIHVLQSNCCDGGDDNYMVINHVRDMILPIGERKKKEKLWGRAVRYINENESRIRVEEQLVRGEPSVVWRWLGGPSTNTSRNKSWQGQAFETQVGSVNSLPCSPTPCLKIRGMVEDGDRNTHAIKKAVLSKCAQQCRILHIAIDVNCVYLKCADPSDAAVAYRNLHGWWYAGNLLTVKYLRLERYMQRFPDSPASGPPYLQ